MIAQSLNSNVAWQHTHLPPCLHSTMLVYHHNTYIYTWHHAHVAAQ